MTTQARTMSTNEQLEVLSDLFEDAGLAIDPFAGNSIQVWSSPTGQAQRALVILTWRLPKRGGTIVSVEGRGQEHKGSFAKKLHRILEQVGYDVGDFKVGVGGNWYFTASWRV